MGRKVSGLSRNARQARAGPEPPPSSIKPKDPGKEAERGFSYTGGREFLTNSQNVLFNLEISRANQNSLTIYIPTEI